MIGLGAILRRELASLFVTPVAYVTASAFLLVQGLHFFVLVGDFSSQVDVAADAGPVETFFGRTVLLYLPLSVVCPLLTMRLFAEERRSGTIETLLTAPVGATAVVLGKYLATLCAYAAMWIPTLLYMWLLDRGGAVDWRVVASGYLAVLAVGAGYLAVGTLTSALSRSQLSAAVMSTMAILALFMIGIGEFFLPEGPGRELASYLSVWAHMNDFSRGLVDTRRLVLDATLVALPLYVTVRAVDGWRLE
jgi:ABC-2 type transport system permease protein